MSKQLVGMTLYCVRHLPTLWNVKGLLQGSRDLPILPISDEVGEEILRLQSALNSLRIDRVLASGYRRAQMTASALKLEFEVDPLLNEMSFGVYEGRSKEHLEQREGVSWISNPRDTALVSSIDDLEVRIFRFVRKYGMAGNVLIFGHGAWIRAAMALAAEGSIRSMNTHQVRNLDLKIVRFPDNFNIHSSGTN